MFADEYCVNVQCRVLHFCRLGWTESALSGAPRSIERPESSHSLKGEGLSVYHINAVLFGAIVERYVTLGLVESAEEPKREFGVVVMQFSGYLGSMTRKPPVTRDCERIIMRVFSVDHQLHLRKPVNSGDSLLVSIPN
jgi:hypothetical protein